MRRTVHHWTVRKQGLLIHKCQQVVIQRTHHVNTRAIQCRNAIWCLSMGMSQDAQSTSHSNGDCGIIAHITTCHSIALLGVAVESVQRVYLIGHQTSGNFNSIMSRSLPRHPQKKYSRMLNNFVSLPQKWDHLGCKPHILKTIT